MALLGGYLVAVFRHDTVEQARRRAAALTEINQEGSARIERRWDALPLREFVPAELPPLAGDLDLFGRASLSHLLNTTYTSVGQVRLRDWLLQPAPPAIIEERQQAVVELAGQADFRDQLAVSARLLGAEQRNYAEFLVWAESEPTLIKRPWVLWVARMLPLITFGLIGAYIFDLTNVHWWIASLIVNQAWIVAFGSDGLAAMAVLSARQGSFKSYAALFRHILDQPLQATALQRIQAQLASGPGRADQHMQRLARIVAFSDLRLSLLFPLLQVFTLWSFHVTARLEHWQRDVGPYVRTWLEALGDLEALTALATLTADHPGWVMPTVSETVAACVQAEELGHPLLAPALARTNDIEVGPPGSFVLITGSNMSGKSTLLRAVGLNSVLAQAGGPVCAQALTLPPLILATSVRVQDSLERGVSYYMAELERLKDVVDLAEATNDRLVLFLLDEILHGTNTAERQIAARRIIRHLLNHGATGIVSTHDLTLAAAPDITEASRPFYFTEHFERGPEGPTMSFDYVLRPGLAVSTNALKLMEIVGLPVDDGVEEQVG